MRNQATSPPNNNSSLTVPFFIKLYQSFNISVPLKIRLVWGHMSLLVTGILESIKNMHKFFMSVSPRVKREELLGDLWLDLLIF